MAGVEQDVRAATINGMTRDELLDTITAHYLKDNEEFNGLRVASTGLTDTELKAVLRQLVAEELGSLHLGPHPNPYIKAFPAHPPGAQLAALDQLDDLAHLIVYPERRHLEQVVDPDAYAGRPYTLRMALGDPQLAPVFFDLSVLERYRNDPRYHYWTDDLSGLISVTDEHYETGTMSESDQVLLQSFGYGYDDAFHRAVCVFLRYLSPLTPAHQQIWKAGELGEGYTCVSGWLRRKCSPSLRRFSEANSMRTPLGGHARGAHEAPVLHPIVSAREARRSEPDTHQATSYIPHTLTPFEASFQRRSRSSTPSLRN